MVILTNLKNNKQYKIDCTLDNIYYLIRSQLEDYIFLYPNRINSKNELRLSFSNFEGKDRIDISMRDNYKLDKPEIEIIDKPNRQVKKQKN
jgi:hypothetical protein